MLFADDVALLSYTVIGPQQQLNILRDTAKKLGLVVNWQKWNVVVFRNGGHIAAPLPKEMVLWRNKTRNCKPV